MVKKRTTGYLTQDIGLVLLLACIFAGALTVGNASEDLFLESILMLIGIYAAILFAGFKLTSFALVVAGFEIIFYTAYRLYLYFTYHINIPVSSYIWIALPIISVVAMFLFVQGSKQTELENEVLREQVEEFVMINALTGLYNLRSLYNDMKKQIAYIERNNLTFSLMIIVLRYEPELKNVLSRSHYEAVIQKLSLVVSDTVRVEDRTYSIDNKGSLAVLLTCDKAGSEYVIKRIRQRVAEKSTFAGITDSAIKVEVKMACLAYDKEQFSDNIMLYKQKVESELQYDV